MNQPNNLEKYVVGHRGVGKDKFNKRLHIPSPVENSIESFRRAQQLGVNMIETDLRRLKSGELVCFHDALIGRKRVNTFRLEELRKIVPTLLTLEELVRSGLNTHFIFELKFGGDYSEIIDEVRSYRKLVSYSWISFDIEALKIAQGEHRAWIPTCIPGINMMPNRIHPYVSTRDLELADSLAINQIAAHPFAITNRVAYNAQERFGLELGAQANDKTTTVRMLERGVSYIYTDDIPVALQAISDFN